MRATTVAFGLRHESLPAGNLLVPDGTVVGARAECAEIPARQPGAALVEGEYFLAAA